MKTTTIRLTESQRSWIQRTAKVDGIKPAELIRKAIDSYQHGRNVKIDELISKIRIELLEGTLINGET